MAPKTGRRRGGCPRAAKDQEAEKVAERAAGSREDRRGAQAGDPAQGCGLRVSWNYKDPTVGCWAVCAWGLGHLRSEGRAGVQGAGQKSGWKAGVLGSRGLRQDESSSCCSTWPGGEPPPLAAVRQRGKGAEPPPPNARPETLYLTLPLPSQLNGRRGNAGTEPLEPPNT